MNTRVHHTTLWYSHINISNLSREHIDPALTLTHYKNMHRSPTGTWVLLHRAVRGHYSAVTRCHPTTPALSLLCTAALIKSSSCLLFFFCNYKMDINYSMISGGPLLGSPWRAKDCPWDRGFERAQGKTGEFEVNQLVEAPELLLWANYTLVEALNRPVTRVLVPFIEARCGK